MTGQPRTLRALRGLSEALRDAVAESKLAYGLSTNSYSYSCLSACLAAERALEVLRDALEAERNVGVADIALARRAPQGANQK